MNPQNSTKEPTCSTPYFGLEDFVFLGCDGSGSLCTGTQKQAGPLPLPQPRGLPMPARAPAAILREAHLSLPR